MQRRDILKGISLAGAGGLSMGLLQPALAAAKATGDGTETAAAMAQLAEVIARKDASFVDPAWRLFNKDMQAEARLMLLHTVNHALDTWLAADPARPMFKRWHYPDKKLFGDNPDAIYYEAPVSAQHSYRISGNIDGATYTSFTVELARDDKGDLGQLGATLNDSEFKVESDGSYEIIASATPQKGNWLRLDPTAKSLTTRHYFELPESVAANPLRNLPIEIDPLEPPGPGEPPSDAAIAASIRRVALWVGQSVNPPGQDFTFPWVSKVPNQLPPPTVDKANEEIGYAAKDNVYSMAPWLLQPDQALIIRGRWPKCRFANIALWNLFLQTLDYRYRQVSLNRVQTALEPDGSFKMILAHQDPGLPNWLDTEGRMIGMMFWRFQLPEGDIQPLTTELVPFETL